MKTLLPLFIFLFILLSCSSPKTRIFIAGDSTAQTYDISQTQMRGWGQLLPVYLSDEVQVYNYAKAGRSTKSFRAEHRWDSIMNKAQKGDYILIQFGHNDTSSKPERHASPIDFKNNLVQFISEARSKQAIPVLLTPIVMRTFENGHLVDNRLKTYPGIIREVAQEQNVLLIDVNTKTRDLILKLGDEASKVLYMPGDDTHTNERGAQEYAAIVAKGLQELKIIK